MSKTRNSDKSSFQNHQVSLNLVKNPEILHGIHSKPQIRTAFLSIMFHNIKILVKFGKTVEDPRLSFGF